MEKVREKRRVEERRVEEKRSEKRKSQKKEEVVERKGRKVTKHCVFPMSCGSGGSKSKLAKAAGAVAR
jgi:predicted nucleic acid binding AN1-type Zn finger protein